MDNGDGGAGVAGGAGVGAGAAGAAAAVGAAGAGAAAPVGFAFLPVPQIKPYMDQDGVAPHPFREWLDTFESMVRMLELRGGGPLPDNTKNWTLFAHLGISGQAIVSKEPVRQRIDDATYPAFKDGITRVFAPRQSADKAWVDLERRTQRPGESIDAFYAALQSLFAACTLPAEIPVDAARTFHLRIRLVVGCSDPTAQQELLSRANTTLEDALHYLRARETAKADAAAIASGGTSQGEVFKVKTGDKRGEGQKSQSAPGRGCPWCGGPKTHKAERESKCPAFKVTCNNCGITTLNKS